MLNSKVILVLFLLLTPQQVKGEDIKGEWIKVKTENINLSFHLNPNDPSIYQYLRLNFFENQKLEIGFSPYSIGAQQLVDYSLKDDILTYNTQRLKVAFKSDTVMILEDTFSSDDINYQPKRQTFYERAYLISKYKLFPIDNATILNDTLTLLIPSKLSRTFPLPGLNRVENYQFLPVFSNSETSFVNLIHENIGPKIQMDNFVFSKVSFDVTSDNKVKNVKILEGDNDRLNKKLVEVLSRSENKWTAINYLGKKLNTTMVFPIKIQIHVSGRHLVEIGDKNFKRKDYNKAIEFYTKSLTFDSKNFSALYNRAASYYQIGDVTKACKDWKRIYGLGRNDSYDLIQEYCK